MSKLAPDFERIERTAEVLNIFGSILLAGPLFAQLLRRDSSIILPLVYLGFIFSIFFKVRAFRVRAKLLSLENPNRSIEIAQSMRLNSIFFSKVHARYWKEVFEETGPHADEVTSEVVRFVFSASKGEYQRRSASELMPYAISYLDHQNLSASHRYTLRASLSGSTLKESEKQLLARLSTD